MENSERRVCRLCLKISESGFHAVEVFERIFSYLLLILHMDVSSEFVVCENCSRDLKQCFAFKEKCLFTENRINLFKKNAGNAKLDLRDVYHSENINETMVNIPYNHIVCRFCLELVKCGKDLETEDVDVVAALGRYFSEMNLRGTGSLIICIPCYESLLHYFNFINNCLAVEEQIKKCKGKSQIKLGHPVHFTSQAVLKEEASDVACSVVKQEKELYVNTKVEVNLENVAEIDKQELEIKDEHIADADEIVCSSSQGILPSFQLSTTPEEVIMYKSDTCVPQTTYKNDPSRDMLTHQNTSDTEHTCGSCEYDTIHKDSLQQHMLTHQSTSDMTLCKHNIDTEEHELGIKPESDYIKIEQSSCDSYQDGATLPQLEADVLASGKEISGAAVEEPSETSAFEKTHRSNLNGEKVSLTTKKIYHCYTCSHQTNYKHHLRILMLRRKSTPEVKMYKCEKCPFQSKDKKRLQGHMKTHVPRIPTYKCERCEFHTDTTSAFQKHVLKHMIYNCYICEYSTKNVSKLQAHMQAHMYAKDVNAITSL